MVVKVRKPMNMFTEMCIKSGATEELNTQAYPETSLPLKYKNKFTTWESIDTLMNSIQPTLTKAS